MIADRRRVFVYHIQQQGLLGAGALAITGLCVIPYKRAQVKRVFNEKVAGLRVNMKDVMHAHFDRVCACLSLYMLAL
jgi:hypothetical protein